MNSENEVRDVHRGERAGVTAELSRLHERALRGGALDKQVKELIALATAIVMRCETGAAYHLHNALEAGATLEQIEEALDVVVVAMGEPAAVQAAQVRRALTPDEGAEDAAPVEASGGKETGKYGRFPYMSPD